MDEGVQGRKIGDPDAEEVVGLTGQGPAAHHFGQSRDEADEACGIVGIMGGHLHLHEGLHAEPEFGRVKPGRVAFDEAFGFKSGAAAGGLTGGKVEKIAKVLRSGIRPALQFCDQAAVG